MVLHLRVYRSDVQLFPKLRLGSCAHRWSCGKWDADDRHRGFASEVHPRAWLSTGFAANRFEGQGGRCLVQWYAMKSMFHLVEVVEVIIYSARDIPSNTSPLIFSMESFKMFPFVWRRKPKLRRRSTRYGFWTASPFHALEHVTWNFRRPIHQSIPISKKSMKHLPRILLWQVGMAMCRNAKALRHLLGLWVQILTER